MNLVLEKIELEGGTLGCGTLELQAADYDSRWWT